MKKIPSKKGLNCQRKTEASRFKDKKRRSSRAAQLKQSEKSAKDNSLGGSQATRSKLC